MDTLFEDDRAEGEGSEREQEEDEDQEDAQDGDGSGGGGDDADGGALESAYQSQRDGADLAIGASSGSCLHMISLADVVAAEIHRRASNPPPLPPQNGARNPTSHSHVLIDRPPHGHLPSDGANADESNGGGGGGKAKGGGGGIARAASSASMGGGGIARAASSASMGESTVPITLRPPPPPPAPPPVAEFYNSPIFVHTSDETGLTMAGVQAGPVGRGEVQMFDLDGVKDGLWVSRTCSTQGVVWLSHASYWSGGGGGG